MGMIRTIRNDYRHPGTDIAYPESRVSRDKAKTPMAGNFQGDRLVGLAASDAGCVLDGVWWMHQHCGPEVDAG